MCLRTVTTPHIDLVLTEQVIVIAFCSTKFMVCFIVFLRSPYLKLFSVTAKEKDRTRLSKSIFRKVISEQ